MTGILLSQIEPTFCFMLRHFNAGQCCRMRRALVLEKINSVLSEHGAVKKKIAKDEGRHRSYSLEIVMPLFISSLIFCIFHNLSTAAAVNINRM